MILYFVDIFFIPLAWLTTAKQQRVIAIGAIGASMTLMRLQAELMYTIGYPSGLFTVIDTDVYIRGLILYNVAYMAYIVALVLRPSLTGVFLLSASIGGFFVILALSTALMVL